MPPTLETPRLLLRPLAPGDLPDLIRLDSDPEVMRYVGSPAGVRSPAEIEERARTDLGMVGKSETFYQVVSPENAPPAANDAPAQPPP